MVSRLSESVIAKIKLCKFHKHQICKCRIETDTRFKALANEVNSVMNDYTKPEKDREKMDADEVNREIDLRNEKLFEKIRILNEKIRMTSEEIREINEEIQKNDEERKSRLESNRQESERRQAPVEHRRCDLLEDLQNIAEVIRPQISELEKSVQDVMTALENAKWKLETLSIDRGNESEDVPRLTRSVSDTLDMPLDFGAVERLTRILSGLRFVKGVGREKYNGRIDGYDGEWRLVDEIDIKHNFIFPTIVGCIDSSSVLITDRLVGDMHTYLLDVNTKRTERVLSGSDKSCVISCALLNNDRIVCGKRRTGYRATQFNMGQYLYGCISVYDRQWKLIKEVKIPRNTTRDDTWVDVAADQDGMIIAAEWGQSKIYVINPNTGNTIQTITCKCNIALRGVLSSGHIIARPSSEECRVFIRINQQGAQREITCWNAIRNICIDPLTDDLYVMTSDSEYKTCVIHQVIRKGSSKKKKSCIYISINPTEGYR